MKKGPFTVSGELLGLLTGFRKLLGIFTGFRKLLVLFTGFKKLSGLSAVQRIPLAL